MPGPDEATFLLLHEIRLRGGVEVSDTREVAYLLDFGYVARSSRGIRITPAGRDEHAAWARVAHEDEVKVQRAYERFLPLNRELIRVCNDWQVRPGGVPNDHRDAPYDWSVINRARALDVRAAPIASRLGRTVARFGTYRARLANALAQVDDGHTDWLTSPRVDSYHTVWMQWHEDLLLALGADRSAEAAAESDA